MRSRKGCKRQYSSVVREQEREIFDGDGVRCRATAALYDELSLVHRQVQGRLVFLLQFVALVNVEHVLGLGSEQQCVQIRGRLDGLAEDFVKVGRHFLRR